MVDTWSRARSAMEEARLPLSGAIIAEHIRTDATGRRLTTRHVVRGHWTHQPYGPKRSLRRLQWVAPFIRGPQEAPFVGTDTVTVWRR
ncbi:MULTISPECIES: hypothetical protein [Cutibacterium]|nr:MULTISPECIES: hypothetical protein [Cutibacterium]